jgi:hypothetical protein
MFHDVSSDWGDALRHLAIFANTFEIDATAATALPSVQTVQEFTLLEKKELSCCKNRLLLDC